MTVPLVPPATVREVDPDRDLAAIVALEAEVFPTSAWSAEQWRDELARTNDNRWYLVAHDPAGALVGYAGLWLQPPDADVQTVAVVPIARGVGLGRRLVDRLVEHSWQAGCTRIFLEVRADNEAALRLYDAVGFVRQGRRSRYYPDGGDAISMRLRRNEPAPLTEVAGG